MKMRKKISWLLSFFMVFSLFMGSAGMIVKADGQKAVVRIARQDSTATGTVYYKWDTAAEWTEVNQTAYNDTPIEINRPDDSLDHTVHFKVVCGTDTIINHCQVNKNGAQDASLDKNILTSESGQAFSVSTSEQVELILEFRTAASGGSGSTTGPASGETIAVTATAVGGAIGDLSIVFRKLNELLKEDGIGIYDTDLNNYCTSQEMGGFSITLMKLDDELRKYYDMPCYCPFYAKGAVEPVGEVADEIEDTAPKKEKKEKKQRIESTYVRGKHYEKLNAEDCRQMLLYIADKILANEPYLTEVDSAIGDGDHGIGMATGMKNVKEVLLDMEGEKNVYSIFEEAGKAMLLSMGGASGVIFGSLYLEGALGTESKDYLTAEDLKAMEEKSLKAIQERGKASVGDKTMVDALAPAVEAMQQHYTEGLEKMLEEAEAGALRGVENTKDCIARFGRAKSLGERALGFQDAGATSTWLIFQSMREFVKGE